MTARGFDTPLDQTLLAPFSDGPLRAAILSESGTIAAASNKVRTLRPLSNTRRHLAAVKKTRVA
jgi:hypothetical protein